MIKTIKTLSLCLLALMLLQNCASSSKASKMRNLVLSDNFPVSHENLGEIEKDLKRFKTLYTPLTTTFVDVVPYTKPFIVAMVKEDAYKRNLTGLKYKEYVKEQVDQFDNAKTYFRMMVTGSSYPKINPEYISGRLTDGRGKSYPIHIILGLEDKITGVNTYNTGGYIYKNYYIAGPSYSTVNQMSIVALLFYVDEKIDFSKEFKLDLDLRYFEEPKQVRFEWLENGRN